MLKLFMVVAVLFPLARFGALAISSNAAENRRREEERREEAEQRRRDADRIAREAEEERRRENERREEIAAAEDRLARLLELREIVAGELEKARKAEKIVSLSRQLLALDKAADKENEKIRKYK